MTLTQAYKNVVIPGLAICPAGADTPEARLMLMAIGNHESKFKVRDQGSPNIPGPACGFFQFERTGGCAQMVHTSTPLKWRNVMKELCVGLNIPFTAKAIWAVFRAPEGDILHLVCARTLLALDPKPLPRIGATRLAFDYYKRNWRPGKPRYKDWPAEYSAVMEVMK